MRLLVIGGTRFVGRHLVGAALQRGHQVTLFHRGGGAADPFRPADPLGVADPFAVADPFGVAEHRHGDRDGDLSALSAGEWDVTIDVCGYLPHQLRTLGRALGPGEVDKGAVGTGEVGRAGRYVFVSSVSAYADTDAPGITERAPLAVPGDPAVGGITDVRGVTDETYGPLKALCEQAAVETFGPGSLILRPTYVVGPHDPTGRFTSWVRRLAAGGDVLAPGPADAPLQVIDARDLAAFALGLIESGASGPFHVAAPQPPHSFGDLLEQVAAAVAPPGTRLHWVGDDRLTGLGLTPAQLPLWEPDESGWLSAVDASAALARGLAPRPIADSARDVLADAATPVPVGVGLDPEREAELLRDLGFLGR